MQSAGWGGSAAAVPSDLDATSGLVAAALAAAWAVLIAKVFTLDAYTGVQMLSLWLKQQTSSYTTHRYYAHNIRRHPIHFIFLLFQIQYH